MLIHTITLVFHYLLFHLELEIIASHKNIVEKFVHKKKKIVGIMWHPEREENFCNFDIELIKKLFNL